MAASNRFTSAAARAAGFASGLELATAAQLKELKRKFQYETKACEFIYFTTVVKGAVVDKCAEEYPIPKGCKVVQWHDYTCDFMIIKKDGSPMFIETKGFFKPKDRKKHQILKKMYPHIDLRIIFQSNGKVSHKTKYSEWCVKQGITYHVLSAIDKKDGQVIPTEWLEE